MKERGMLLEHLKNRGVLRSPALIEAFRRVDRKDFVRESDREEPYGDYPLGIGHGQTISQPYTVVFMLELLGVKEGQKVLDIGSGSGWTTTLLAAIVGEQGKVTGLERIGELVDFGSRNLAKYPFPWAAIRQAGEDLGMPGGQFDRILVSASAERMPMELIDQLEEGGVLVVPVGTSIFRIARTIGGEADVEEYPGFVFVPLV